jgi:hypothetical protein
LHHVLAEEVVRNLDVAVEDTVQDEHPVLRLVLDPLHVLWSEVEEDRHVVRLADGPVAVEVGALEGVGDHGSVLDTGQVAQAGGTQREDGAFELPGRRVGAWKREVPGDVVLEDRRRARIERLSKSS